MQTNKIVHGMFFMPKHIKTTMEKSRILTTLFAGLALTNINAQTVPAVPRLVVNITIDQLRTDYMEAFAPLFGEGGFKKLLNESRIYNQVEYSSSRLDRASAIASIATGATPYDNGIVGTRWLDRETLLPVECVDDKSFEGIGTDEKSSANRLIVSTISDELKVATAGKSIVYAIAPFKDAAIIGAGHAADGAVWMNDRTGEWCTSKYYGTLPGWARTYNEYKPLGKRIKDYAWEPSSDLVGNFNYFLSGGMSEPFKHKFEGDGAIMHFKESGPINDEVADLAVTCIQGTQLGVDAVTDYLAITFYAGNYKHLAAADSPMELQDTYVRIDNALSRILKEVDKKIGFANALFVITSTGYVDNKIEDLSKYNIPSGTFYINRTAALLNMYLIAVYGQGQYVEACHGSEMYLNHKLIEDKQLNFSEILERCESFLIDISGIKDVYTSTRLQLGAWTPGISKFRNGYNPKCSGDILIEVSPGWTLLNENTNETHYSSEAYVPFPLFLFGSDIKPEKIETPITVERIAPTLATCLRIRAPNACSATPLERIR